MRFRKKLYRRRFTPKGRHNYYRHCRPRVLRMRIDANKEAYFKNKPVHLYRKNG